jgi:hypothetical protein
MTFSPSATASSESYAMSILMSMSAQPMTPRPIFRLPRASSSIAGSGYWLTSMTSSRKRTAALHDVAEAVPRDRRTGIADGHERERFTEPRLHAS